MPKIPTFESTGDVPDIRRATQVSRVPTLRASGTVSTSQQNTSVNNFKPVLLGEETTEGCHSVISSWWATAAVFCLAGLLPGLTCSAILTILLRPSGSLSDVGVTSARLPGSSDAADSPALPQDSRNETSSPLMTTERAPAMPVVTSKTLASYPSANETTCTSTDCHFVAQWLRQKLNFSVNPCHDFYGFVCDTFKGPANSALREVRKARNSTIIAAAYGTRVPPTGQTSWQKAAGLFQACVAQAKSNGTETGHLVAWMTTLGLDLKNLTRLARVDPVDIMMRCAIDFGVPAVFSIKFHGNVFLLKKRAMELDYSEEDDEWQKKRQTIQDQVNVAQYVQLLGLFGVQSSKAQSLASGIRKYEVTLNRIVNRTRSPKAPHAVAYIRHLGVKTKPYVTSDKWAATFSKYTNNTYTINDPVLYKKYVLDIFVKLYKSARLKGLRYLIAWSVFRQLLQYTQPKLLAGNQSVAAACYQHVYKVMKLALVSPYLHSIANKKTVKEADKMVQTIREALRAAMASSNWVRGNVRDVALRKLKKLKYYIGSPGRQLDPAFVEKHYAHQMWADQQTWFYDETDVNAYNLFHLNIVVIPTGILQNPNFFSKGPSAINYGALGQLIGHELMHGYDVAGIQYDDNNEQKPWGTSEFTAEYTKRTLCLRDSHKSVKNATARQAVVDNELDSENLADFVGTVVAYAAYASLPDSQRNVTLPGLDMAAERLFFVAQCAKWCEYKRVTPVGYAPGRSRCIVPLMNMPEFSAAFECAPGESMNPLRKCTFW